jgi:hypothetical protein
VVVVVVPTSEEVVALAISEVVARSEVVASVVEAVVLVASDVVEMVVDGIIGWQESTTTAASNIPSNGVPLFVKNSTKPS